MNGRSIRFNRVDLLGYVEADMAGVTKDCLCETKTDQEIKCEQVQENVWTRDESGRFEIKHPWKVDPNLLLNNRWHAVQRDKSNGDKS